MGGIHKFRDTLFKRYSDVSFLLSSMRFSQLPEFIVTMYREKSDDDLKANWLSNPFRDSSFDDFKDKIYKEHFDSLKPKELVEIESKVAMSNALDMLNALGGDGVGD